MNVQPVILDDYVKAQLQPSLDRGNCTWEEIESLIADHVAVAWQIGEKAFALTMVNADNEVEILLSGGQGALRAAPVFLQAMHDLPEHEGLTLRIEGRRGWRRFCKDWNCQQVDGGKVILTKRL